MSMNSPAHLHIGDLYTVHGFLTFIKRLTNMCLQSIQHHFVDWTKPATTSLWLGTVADLARNKSELVAENALLRQEFIILSRQVKRPVFQEDRSDAPGASGEDGSDLEANLVHRSARDASAVASPGFSALLEVQIQSKCLQTKDIRRDRGLDQGNGQGQPTVGSGADPRRITQAG